MRRVFVVGVAVFAALEVFVAYKLISDRPAAAVSGEARTEPSSPAPSVTGPPTPSGAIDLWVGANGRLLRSWTGSCSEPGRSKLEISNDAGRHFDEIALPLLGERDDGGRAEVVRTVLAVHATDDQNLSVVASDARCRTHGYTTSDGGASWQDADISGWYVSADRSEVGAGDETSEVGCVAESVVPLPDSARNAKVLCRNGMILGTDDSGATWTVLGELPEAIDMTFTGLRNGLAVRQTSDCAVEVMDTGNAGGDWESIGCVLEKSEFEPSAIVSRGDRVYVAVGTAMYRSDDGGHQWSNAEAETEAP